MKVRPLYDDVETTPRTVYWQHFSYARRPQPVVLSLRLADSATSGWAGELEVKYTGGGVSDEVWHGRELQFDLPAIPTPDGANKLLDRVIPLAQAILDHGGPWALSPHDPPTPVGALRDYLNNGAGFADEDIVTVAVWPSDAITSDWVAGEDITASTLNEQLWEVAARIRAELALKTGDDVAMCEGLLDWLIDHRNRLRDAAAEAV